MRFTDGGSLRQRMLILVLLPLLFLLPATGGLLYWWNQQAGYRQLLMKVNTDIAVARERLQSMQQQYQLQLALETESSLLRQYLTLLQHSPAATASDAMQATLTSLQHQTGFDYLQLLRPDGCNLLKPEQCSVVADALLQRAATGEAGSGLQVLDGASLAQLSPVLAHRAVISPATAAGEIETRGMLLQLSYPLRDSRGEVEAVLMGGVLMNGNFGFVDRLRDTVYGEGSLPAGSLGTVTLFLDDLRISTNVPADEGRVLRAIGTRVSEQVRQHVLERGQPWLDRAYVVNDWYISGYQPLKDLDGKIIGMLYTGFLEAPFKDEFYRWLNGLLLLFLVTLVGCAFWAIAGARRIFKPVEQMVAVIRNIEAGQRQRMSVSPAGDELTTLSVAFNSMLDRLEQQHDQISRAADQLELKVAERTTDLKAHIQLLQRTREQLVAKGKLAAIGELSAGIAHEINNPTAVILGYLDLMMAELGSAGEPVQSEAQMIVEQVERIRTIINSLLQYARPDSRQVRLTPQNINQLVTDTVALVRHDLKQKGVLLQLDLRADRPVTTHRSQLQQVLINLLINAANASRAGSRITVRSRNRQQGVLLAVRDAGCGMAPELLERIFDPFFSQTAGGTGLGLSVSYALLQQLGAEIEVRSRPGVGSVFFIWLKPQHEFSPEPPLEILQ